MPFILNDPLAIRRCCFLLSVGENKRLLAGEEDPVAAGLVERVNRLAVVTRVRQIRMTGQEACPTFQTHLSEQYCS